MASVLLTDIRFTTEREDLQIAGCWVHVRRRYDEALKALPKEKRNQSTAHRGLVMIQAIYRNEKPLKELSAEERRERRQLSAIIYSIAETAKANGLKPYEYFELLLTEIPMHLDDDDLNFCEKLLPWSKDLPEKCRKKQ